MSEILDIVFHSFWTFVGTLLLIYLLAQLIQNISFRILRTIVLRKNGWPPAHCDADGDFKEDEKDDSE